MRRWHDVEPGERRAVALSFACFFSLMCSWYVLRAVREEMGVLGGTGELRWLFAATFGVTLLLAPAFAWLVATFPRRRVVPLTYAAVALLLVALFAALESARLPHEQVARVAFVALSSYSLFVVSAFWSLVVDVFDQEQGRRLFGAIAAGGSAGALAGPALAAVLATRLGTAPLFLVAAGLLAGSVALTLALAKTHRRGEGPAREAPLGGSILEGFRRSIQDPMLRRIALQTLIFTTLATFLYLQQARIVKAAISGSAERTALFARIDLFTNAATLAVQALVTGPLLSRAGLFAGLALAPALAVCGFGLLAAVPLLAVLVGFQCARRAVHHAVERPAREVLFTSVGPADRYKSKSFLDTVVYRGGDASAAQVHDALLSLGPIAPALCAIPIAAAGVVLARDLASRARTTPPGEDAP